MLLMKNQYVSILGERVDILTQNRFTIFNKFSMIPDEISDKESEIDCPKDGKYPTVISNLPSLVSVRKQLNITVCELLFVYLTCLYSTASKTFQVTDNICSYLRPNDILNFRGVCHWAKEISDEYIRLRTPSKKPIKINISDESGLKIFLERNRNSTINIPSSRLFLYQDSNKKKGVDFENQGLIDLAGLYGKQITHLEVSAMCLPILCPDEMKFYQQFSNLKSLTIGTLYIRDTVDRFYGRLTFPENFKTLTRLKLKTKDCPNSRHDGNNVLGKLIEFCTSLEYISCPIPTIYDREYDEREHLRLLVQIRAALRKGIHKNLRIINLRGFAAFGHEYGPDAELAPLVTGIVTGCNVKCLNFNTKGFKADQLELIAPEILSLEISVLKKKHCNVQFPNVRKLVIRDGFWDSNFPLEILQEKLSQKMFPFLKKLVYEERCSQDQQRSALLWSNFPNLEEIVIFSDYGIVDDSTFLGPNPDEPAFLNLKSKTISKSTLNFCGAAKQGI